MYSFAFQLMKIALENIPFTRTIGEQQYADRLDLTKIVIPRGIESIGPKAFENCINAEKIVFLRAVKNSLNRIGSRAFAGCTSLRQVQLPEGVKEIGNGVFAGCTSLESVILPESMAGSELNGGLFSGCHALREVQFPSTLKGSFANLFPECESLSGIVIPKGVEDIGFFAFEHCRNLESVTIPDTVVSIGRKAFHGCTSLKELSIPDSVKCIDSFFTFRDCTALEQIRLPADIRFLSRVSATEHYGIEHCFMGCTGLKTVILGETAFSVEGEFSDAVFLRWCAELAASGSREAQQTVRRQISEVLTVLTDSEDAAFVERFLDGMPPSAFSAEEIEAAMEYAGMTGSEEIFRLLEQYRTTHYF